MLFVDNESGLPNLEYLSLKKMSLRISSTTVSVGTQHSILTYLVHNSGT